MTSFGAVAANLRNKGLVTRATPRVLACVPTRLIHGSTRKEASVCDKATEAQQKVAKKADEGAQTISDAAGSLKDKAKKTLQRKPGIR
ncbi:unnamed protein product [Thlaspi arvense]|uniref:Uncharacterized protein n=1 Tax=Thlaspi arvense TaxID=13288 RepID=A0AAU9RZD9_THLAR|nr:unnamed protein product [Thlaspi arvense]